MSENTTPPVRPWDSHNRELVANVHPSDWVNPTPAPRYNLVVIGAGTAGLVTAIGAAGLGAKVALIERHLMGGDCLNVGCVPSKSLIASGRVASIVREAAGFGILNTDGAQVDFGAVMERMRRIRSGISRHDSVRRFSKNGIDVFLGAAQFDGTDGVRVGEAVLSYKRAVICSGARAHVPDVEGLREAGFLTNETVFSLTELPRRLAVIGGGPIGCELAQTFQALGSQVTLIHSHDRLLNRDDPDASEIILSRFKQAGIDTRLRSRLERIEVSPGGKRLHLISGHEDTVVEVDEILIGAGRVPNVEGLGLDAVGVETDPRKGVLVNDHLQTTNPKIYAAGDVCMDFKFTHAADFAARIVIQNALFLGLPFVGRKRLSGLSIPRCTYTSPEIAQIGMSMNEALHQGLDAKEFVQPMTGVDRAITEGHEAGFVKILADRKNGRILGATIVAENAGDLIGEISVAMKGRVSLGRIASAIHPYPTTAEAIRKCGDAYNRTKLTPTASKVFQLWTNWTR